LQQQIRLPLVSKKRLTEILLGAERPVATCSATNDLTLDEVSDAAYIYAVWDGKPKVITDATGRTVTPLPPGKRIGHGRLPIMPGC